MSDLYQYDPLDLGRDAIRLCRLFRRSQDPQRPPIIRCELFQSYLHKAEGVPYEALSYTWACEDETSETIKHTIIMSGKVHHVTTNLFHALSSIRLDHEDRIVWIDALCINQADHRERGHQVGQMAQTYSCAQGVLVWLGMGNALKHSIIRWMDALDRRVNARPNFSRQSSPVGLWVNEVRNQGYSAVTYGKDPNDHSQARWPLTMKREKLPQLDVGVEDQYPLPSLTEIEQQEVPSLYRAAWFTRIWVIQEAAKARSALVMYDRYSVQSSTFVLVPQLFDFEVPEGTQAVLDLLPGPLRKTSWWNNARDLRTLMDKFGSSCKASDERDKVYALLGLASDASPLQPDYDVDTRVVIERTIAHLMATRGEACRADLWTRQLPQWGMDQFLEALPEADDSLFSWSLRYSSLEAVAVEVVVLGLSLDSMNDPKWPSDSLDESKPQLPRLLRAILGRPDINPQVEHNGKAPLAKAAQSRPWAAVHRLLGDPRVDRWAMRGYSNFLWETPNPITQLDPAAMTPLFDTIRLFLSNLPHLAREGLLGETSNISDHPLSYAHGKLLSLKDDINRLVENLVKEGIHEITRNVKYRDGPYGLDGPDGPYGLDGPDRLDRPDRLARRWGWLAQLKSCVISDYIAAHLELGLKLKNMWVYARPDCILWLAVGLGDIPAVLRLLVPELKVGSFNPIASLLLVAVIARNVAMAKTLLEKGWDSYKAREEVKISPALQIAVINKQEDMVKLLLRNGANPNKEPYGLTPLDTAIKLGDIDMVELLLNHGANPNTERYGSTPLDTAIRLGNIAMVKLLLRNGANPNKEPYMSTPLDIAIKLGDIDMVELLLNHGANPNKERYGSTPLDTAIKLGDIDMVKLLLNHGADPNNGRYGLTPLDTAIKLGDIAMVELLRCAGFVVGTYLGKHGEQQTASARLPGSPRLSDAKETSISPDLTTTGVVEG
ncbi:hypothetical protein MCOR21_011106 [Pyricularia oryzae]|nr:hypothetical protein MCOR21_011106 [Pyricularia oryzae]